jgi:phosphoribosyl 1,2-cyclic phosphate phosphodiesterase
MRAPECPIRLVVLGSGTSVGVPAIGCDCPVCASVDPRDNRLRASVLVQTPAANILIDTTPDFRFQALRAKIPRVDAVLFTHAHADHIMGLDDIRAYNFRQGSAIPVYASPQTLSAIRRAFQYIFDGQDLNTHIPRLELNPINTEAFEVCGVTVTPIPVLHGSLIVYGFRFGSAAYLTDHNDIPEASLQKLEGLDVLFLDALRHRPHPTHSTVERSLQYVARLKPNRAYFTHICHDLPHAGTEEQLPDHVRLAYDGLVIDVAGPVA